MSHAACVRELQLVEALLLCCCCRTARHSTRASRKRSIAHYLAVARRGREPGLPARSNGRKVPLVDWARSSSKAWKHLRLLDGHASDKPLTPPRWRAQGSMQEAEAPAPPSLAAEMREA